MGIFKIDKSTNILDGQVVELFTSSKRDCFIKGMDRVRNIASNLWLLLCITLNLLVLEHVKVLTYIPLPSKTCFL